MIGSSRLRAVMDSTSQSTTSGRSLRRRSDGTVMASTAMLQTARAPLGVSGLLDAAAGGLFCSVTFMLLRFGGWHRRKRQKPCRCAAAFLLFQRFGLLALSLAEAL